MAGTRPQRPHRTTVTMKHHHREMEIVRKGLLSAVEELQARVKTATRRAEDAEARADKAEAGLTREKERAARHIDGLMRCLHLPADWQKIPRDKNSPLDVALTCCSAQVLDIIGRVHEPLLVPPQPVTP